MFKENIRWLIFGLTLVLGTLVFANYTAYNFTLICSSHPSTHLSPLSSNSSSFISSNKTSLVSTSFHPSSQQVNVLLSAIAIGSVLGSFPIPSLIASIGIKHTVIAYFGCSIIASLGFPLAYRLGFVPALVVRLLQGLCFSAQMVLIGSVSKEWFPAAQTGNRLLLLSTHYQLGPLLSMTIAGPLCTHSWGWSSVYYLLGTSSLVLLLLFVCFYRTISETHWLISASELNLIRGKGTMEKDGRQKQLERSDPPPEATGTPTKTSKNGAEPIPYRVILSDWMVWLVLFVFFAGELGMQTFVLYGPTFLNQALGMSISETSHSASLTYLVALSVKSLATPVNNFFARFLSEPKRIKLFVMIPQGLQIVCFLPLSAMALFSANNMSKSGGVVPVWLANASFVFVVAFAGLDFLGVVRCAQMISEQHSHLMLNWVSAINSAILVALPLLISVIIPEHRKLEQWGRLFLPISVLLVLSLISFTVFAKSEVRHWATNKPKRCTVAPKVVVGNEKEIKSENK